MSYQALSAHGITWVHIRKPDRDDIKKLKELVPLDPLVEEYLAEPTLHPALEEFGDHLFFILHFPIIFHNDQQNIAVEVDFLLTRNTVVTITYRAYPRLNTLFKRYVNDEAARNLLFRRHSGFILYEILEQLFVRIIDDRDYIETEINSLENRVFHQRDRNLVEDIAHLRRDILDFRRIFLTQGSVLGLLPKALRTMFGAASIPQFNNLVVTQDKISQLIANHKETIEVIHETNESLVANRISQIVRILTIFSAIILPLTLVSSIWGMNQEFMPLRDDPRDFWIVLGLMVLIGLSMFAIFRKIRWL